MQKSMVHELTGLTSSQFINNRSTFISTAFNQGDYQLRKSRIQNLPSYRKQDLSSKPNFVIVFQSIEIQRLSNQIEALRIALKDQQRQNFNIQNYEVQIRQLNQKCFAYEMERAEYREEVDKLNMICEKLYEELELMKSRYNDADPTLKEKYRLEKQRSRGLEDDIQKWRYRYNALQISKSKQMQDMRLMLQNQRKSMIDRQLKQLSLKSQLQRQTLQKQIRKIRELCQTKETELKRVTNKVLQLEILNKELKQYEKTIYEYQNKFAMLSQEMMRLNDVLRRKEEEIDRLVGLEANYKRREKEYQRKMRQIEQNAQKIRQLQSKLQSQKSRCLKLQSESSQYKNQLSQIPQFKQAIQQISTQSEKLKQMVRYKIGEIDTWKNKYQQVDAELKENKIRNEEKIPGLENKIGQLTKENQRLNGVIKARTVQVEGWKDKIMGIEKQLMRYAGLEKEKKNLENQLNNNIKQVSQLQASVRQLENQNRRLGEIEKELSKEKSEKQQSRKQIYRLNNVVKGSSQKLQNLEKKCGNLERQLKNYGQIQEQIRIYKQKQINMTKEIDRINGIIVDKIKQIQALKDSFQRFDSKLNQYQGLQKKLMESVGQTQKLIQDLDQSRKQSMMLQDKLISTQSQSKTLKNDVFSLTQQREQLTRVLNTKTQELQSTQGELSQFQAQVTRLRSFESRFLQIQQKYKTTQTKLAELTRRYKNQQNKSLELNQKLEQTVADLIKVKRQGAISPKFREEYSEVVRQSERREKQIKSLQQRILLIETILKKLRQATSYQHQTQTKTSQKLSRVSKHFQLSSQSFKKVFQLQTEIIKLNQHIMALQSKLNLTSLENDSYKHSQSRNLNLGVGLDLNPISLAPSKSEGVLTKSPIDMLATKRLANQDGGSPVYAKSQSVANIESAIYSNTATTTNNPYSYTYTTNTNNYNNNYNPSSTAPQSQSKPKPPTTTNTEYQFTNYHNTNTTSNINTTNTNTSNKIKRFEDYKSTNNVTNIQQRDNTYSGNSYAGRNGYGGNGGEVGGDGYSYAYQASGVNGYNKANSPSKGVDARQRSNANFNTYTTTNIDTYSYPTNTTNTINTGVSYKQQGLKADTYMNYEAFSSKRNSIGVKPAGLPLQFRSTNRADY